MGFDSIQDYLRLLCLNPSHGLNLLGAPHREDLLLEGADVVRLAVPDLVRGRAQQGWVHLGHDDRDATRGQHLGALPDERGHPDHLPPAKDVLLSALLDVTLEEENFVLVKSALYGLLGIHGEVTRRVSER